MVDQEARQGEVTITLTKEEAEQFRNFVSRLPSLNAVIDQLQNLSMDGQLESLSMTLSALKSIKDALNDDAVQSLATTAGKTVELVSLLSHDSSVKPFTLLRERGDDLYSLLLRLSQLQRDGVFDSITQAAYVLKASLDALNDEAVSNLASTMSEAATMWKNLSPVVNNPETVSVLNRLVRMEKEGVLSALEDAGYAVKSIKDSLNDEAMVNLATIVASALNIWRIMSPYVEAASKSPLPLMLQALAKEGLTDQLEKAKPRSGMSILSPSDPDIRKGFGVFLEILKAVGSQFNSLSEESKR
jgi:uncharacterized protein YjgD (DUF1641 family)